MSALVVGLTLAAAVAIVLLRVPACRKKQPAILSVRQAPSPAARLARIEENLVAMEERFKMARPSRAEANHYADMLSVRNLLVREVHA